MAVSWSNIHLRICVAPPIYIDPLQFPAVLYEKLDSVTFIVVKVSNMDPPLFPARLFVKIELYIVDVEVRESAAMKMAPPLFEAKLFWKVQLIISIVEPCST